MDYFSKFRKCIVPPKAQPTSAMQLSKFHKCWDYIHNIFIAEDRKTNLHVKQTEIPEKLRQMVDMLVDEEARQEDNTTGVCMEYFLKHGILQYLVNTSEKMDYPEGIRVESIRTIASMVDLLDDRFLVHNAVHKPTIKLLRFCILDERQSELYREDLVDLMYIICSKIHGFPALLNIFFHDKQWLTTPQKTIGIAHVNASSSTTHHSSLTSNNGTCHPEYEFLLFTYLLRFVHHEGRSGDFARTGLLFLIEMATDQLGDFILESDFATIMAAGLGALYSQLPRKLIIRDEMEINSTPASYLLGHDLDLRAYPSEELGIEQSSSEQFKYQLDSFLKLLEFCQDVLLRCPNDAISERLLQCIRKIFLENILYPSILECSDIDGSSVAVVSYIDLILQTIQQQDLATIIVGFLMDASDDENEQCFGTCTVQASSISQPSQYSNLFCGVELDKFKSSPYFTAAERFTLKDLIFSRLKSSSQTTVIATLKLLRTLIVKHCRFADRLLTFYPDLTRTDDNNDDDDERRQPNPSTIISHHIREIELYFALISAIDQAHADDILTMGYEDYLKDIEASIECDDCFQEFAESPSGNKYFCLKRALHEKIDFTSTSKSERRRSFKYGQREVNAHRDQDQVQETTTAYMSQQQARTYRRIRPTDPLIQILLGLLSHFFAQSSELNLALSGAISALALCPYQSLEGWISFCESDRADANAILDLSVHSNNTTATSRIDSRILDNELYGVSMLKNQEKDQDDDQSVDFGADRNSAWMTAPTQFKSFPPFYTLLRTLTQQVDYYRSEVDGFDKLLEERWNGLLFGEPTASNVVSGMVPATSSSSSSFMRRGSYLFDYPSLSSSTNTLTATTTSNTASVMSKLFNFGINKVQSSSSVASNNITTVNMHKRRNSNASMMLIPSASMMPNPSKSLSSSTTTAAANSSSLLMQQGSSSMLLPSSTSVASLGISQTLYPDKPSFIPVINPLSPLAMHAKKTSEIRLQPLFPSNFEIERDEPILNLDEEDEDVFAPLKTNPSDRKRMDKSTEISLSMLLNNVVILEEMIKELVAIMQVRRSLGIDKIRYT